MTRCDAKKRADDYLVDRNSFRAILNVIEGVMRLSAKVNLGDLECGAVLAQ